MKLELSIYFIVVGVFFLIGYFVDEYNKLVLPVIDLRSSLMQVNNQNKMYDSSDNKKNTKQINYLKKEGVFFTENKKSIVPIPSLSEVLYGKSVETLNKYKLLGISNENGYKAILQDGTGKIIRVKKNDILSDNITVVDIDNKSVLLKITVDNKTSERRIKIYDITFKEWK